MSANGWTTELSEHAVLVASELRKRELPIIAQFEPIADFEELDTFAEAHPTPIEFREQHPAWQLESVAARVLEAIAIAAHEPLKGTEWQSLARILLEHTEYLWTYPEAPTTREKLTAGSALALSSCVCTSVPQAELWRLAGFGRIDANLAEVAPKPSDIHLIQPLDAAFMLANALKLPILDSAVESYRTVLNRNFTHQNSLKFPLSDNNFFHYLNLEFDGLENVKSAISKGDISAAILEYTNYRKQINFAQSGRCGFLTAPIGFSENFEDISHLERTDTFSKTKLFLDCLLKLTIYPTPVISATTEIGIAALLFPEFRFSEQLFTLASRRYKWIADAFFYPDGFHKERSLKSQTAAITDFARFLHIYNDVKHLDTAQPNQINSTQAGYAGLWDKFQSAEEMETLLKKQLEACIFICQPDLSFPPFGANTSDNSDPTGRCGFLTAPTPNQTLSHALIDTGFYVMRDSRDVDAQFLCFDDGTLGKSVCEGQLSFVLFAHGRQLITHNSRSNKNAPRADGETHNIILINGKKQQPEPEVTHAPDTRWTWTPSYDFVESWYKTYDYQHKRSIFYVKGEYFILHDLVLGEGEHSLEQVFHISTSGEKFIDPHIATDVGQVWTRESGKSNLFLGYVNPINLKVKIDGNCLSFQSQCVLPAAINIVMFPMKPHAEQYPKIESLAVCADADVLATGFTVQSNVDGYCQIDTFLISDDGFAGMTTSDGKIEFAGEYLFLRGDKFVMINGRYLKVENKILAEFDEPREHYINWNL